MIFVSVGTTKFPFDRLLRAVDESLLKLDSKEKLIVQKGTSGYHFKYLNSKVSKEISFEDMIKHLKKARVVVLQGGPATIWLALKYGKNMPLVIPRCRNFREHVNDHQQYYARFLSEKNLVKAVFPQEDLTQRLIEYFPNPFSETKKEKTKASSLLIKKMTEYTEAVQK